MPELLLARPRRAAGLPGLGPLGACPFIQFDRDLQRDVGMPRTYFEILWLLHQAPDRALRMSDLAERTGSQASRITHAVGRLEQAGQVRRELCTEDRRGWFAVLTDEGLETLRVAAPRYAEVIRRAFSGPAVHFSTRTADRDRRDLLERLHRPLERLDSPLRGFATTLSPA